MTSTAWSTLALFINDHLDFIVGLVVAVLTYLTTMYPTLKTNRLITLVDAIVTAAQQTIATPPERFATADKALAQQQPNLTPEERKLWIEARVATNKVLGGAAFAALPPAAQAEAPVDMKALFTQAFVDAAPAIEQMLEDKVSVLRTAQAKPAPARTAAGTFAPAAAQPEAVQGDAPASTTGA